MWKDGGGDFSGVLSSSISFLEKISGEHLGCVFFHTYIALCLKQSAFYFWHAGTVMICASSAEAPCFRAVSPKQTRNTSTRKHPAQEKYETQP